MDFKLIFCLFLGLLGLSYSAPRSRRDIGQEVPAEATLPDGETSQPDNAEAREEDTDGAEQLYVNFGLGGYPGYGGYGSYGGHGGYGHHHHHHRPHYGHGHRPHYPGY